MSQYKTARTRGTHQQLMLHSSDAQRSFLMEPYDNRFECYDTIKKKKKKHTVSVCMFHLSFLAGEGLLQAG